MGNYQICDYCGNLHEKRNKRICLKCENEYQRLRSVVEEHPDTIVLELANLTGVGVSRILSFVSNGYFIMKEGSIALFE
ncbi:hypothetical protein [Paenibacillus sp. CMAA1364]